jgi:PAS domain-containing protein
MYFIVDPHGIVLSVNPFGGEQLGYTVDELVAGFRPEGILGARSRSLERKSRAMLGTTRPLVELGTTQDPEERNDALGTRNGQGCAQGERPHRVGRV